MITFIIEYGLITLMIVWGHVGIGTGLSVALLRSVVGYKTRRYGAEQSDYHPLAFPDLSSGSGPRASGYALRTKILRIYQD